MTFSTWLRTTFSDVDGMGSYSRFASFVALCAVIYWVTYIVRRTGALPSLDGPTAFVAACYGLNLVHNGVTTILASKQDKSQ